MGTTTLRIEIRKAQDEKMTEGKRSYQKMETNDVQRISASSTVAKFIYNSEQFKRKNMEGFPRRNNTIQITAQNSKR